MSEGWRIRYDAALCTFPSISRKRESYAFKVSRTLGEILIKNIASVRAETYTMCVKYLARNNAFDREDAVHATHTQVCVHTIALLVQFVRTTFCRISTLRRRHGRRIRTCPLFVPFIFETSQRFGQTRLHVTRDLISVVAIPRDPNKTGLSDFYSGGIRPIRSNSDSYAIQVSRARA